MEMTQNESMEVGRIPFAEVTESALVKRINRRLKANDTWTQVRKARERESHNLGQYYVLDTYRNVVEDTYLDIEAMARDLGVMHASERVVEEL